MDNRAAKLALARKKLKDHQEKKLESFQKDNILPILPPEQHLNTNSTLQNDNQASIGNELNITNIPSVSQQNNQDLPNVGFHLNENISDNFQTNTDSLTATEILISNKRNLEIQVNDLQSKLAELEINYSLTTEKYNIANQRIQNLENDLRNTNDKYLKATNELLQKDNTIKELNSLKLMLTEENNSINEQLEFTKTMLTAKESENNSIYSQLFNLQNQLDATQLQLQQLTNGAFDVISNTQDNINTEENTHLMQKISNLEQQLKDVHKEKDNITSHYQHYVNDLNEHLKGVLSKNEEQGKEIKSLLDRESSLVDQIAEMEIRIQSFRMQKNTVDNETTNSSDDFKELQCKYDKLQEIYNDIVIRYDHLQKQYTESNAKLIELSQPKEPDCERNEISMSKLNADITSDKVAAQRATEQNKKLKQDMQGLEDAFVKMSKDKLELTEKLTAEKDLNKKLTITFADLEEKAKDMQRKLKAKDEEMIRLLSSYRDIEKKYECLINDMRDNPKPDDNAINKSINVDIKTAHKECIELVNDKNDTELIIKDSELDNKCYEETVDVKKNSNIPKEDAMEKLQQRFMKIMEEVADLSDEKHRLEHIILQLQNETETICEYVALYQQQRSLLKKRDEERSAQIKMFEEECNKLRTQLEELSAILIRLAEDKELISYFQMEARRHDIQRILSLLTNLKNNSLVDPNKNVDFKNFNPCNCCSGKLIEI